VGAKMRIDSKHFRVRPKKIVTLSDSITSGHVWLHFDTHLYDLIAHMDSKTGRQ
jgi:hypothetical protein